MNWTIDELICVCIARQVRDGEVWAQGINTPLVMAGLILAKCTHAPNVRFASAVGQGLCQDWAPLSICRNEDMWLGKALMHVGFAVAAADLLPAYKLKEFFRPAQVDAAGNFNNIAIGRDYRRPRLRLPGSGGIPDVTVQYDHVSLYVPRHTPAVFRPRMDFVSGLGHAEQRSQGAGPQYLVSDLGQFVWLAGQMHLRTFHPGVTVEHIRRKTGFELHIMPDATETLPPSPEEVQLLRDTIDPLGVRKLETLAGGARKALLREILRAEGCL